MKLNLDDQENHLDSYAISLESFIHVLQSSPIPQTSNWSGTFFAVSYSNSALRTYCPNILVYILWSIVVATALHNGQMGSLI